MAILAPQIQQKFTDDSGAPLVGGKIYTYEAGTTTPLETYTDATEDTANANPIILDSNGACDMWLGSRAYKFVITDSADVTLKTIDNVNQASENTESSPDLLQNFGLSASTGSSALTINLTNSTGADPTALSPVTVGFRSTTLSSGLTSVLTVGSSLGMVVSSGSTLGHANGVTDYIYVYLLNYNGVAEMAVSSTLYPETGLYTTVAEGAGGAADSRSPIYSIAARTNVPIRVVGRLTVNQATAGTWSTAPSQIQAGAISQIFYYSTVSEGTWTPAWSFGGGNTGMTFSVQSGYYFKTGRMVTCWGWLTFTSRGSSTGSSKLTGLPFTSVNNSNYGSAAAIVFSSWSGSTGTMTGYVNPNSTDATILKSPSGVGSSSALSSGDMSDNSIFTFSFSYLTA